AKRFASRPAEIPRTTVLDRVMTAGIDKSIPRDIMTSASPTEQIVKKAASGMIAKNVDGSRLRGTTTAPSATRTSKPIHMARKRNWIGAPLVKANAAGVAGAAPSAGWGAP